MNIQLIHTYLQQWAIDADTAGLEDLSISLWTAAGAAEDVIHTDDEDDDE